MSDETEESAGAEPPEMVEVIVRIGVGVPAWARGHNTIVDLHAEPYTASR